MTHQDRLISFIIDQGLDSADADGWSVVVSGVDSAGHVVLDWTEYDMDGGGTARHCDTGLSLDQFMQRLEEVSG